VIAHNAKAFDLNFILHRAILMKWNVELIMNGLKIMCMDMWHLVFLDSISFLPFTLRKLSDAFGVTVSKSWYPHYFNTRANLDYVGKSLDVSYHGVDEMSASEGRVPRLVQRSARRAVRQQACLGNVVSG
jgi:hypothetical protein